MNSRMLALCLVALLAVAPAFADSAQVPVKPTFYKDVLPILQENCQLCHRDKGANFGGMVAPMELTGYRQVRPWAKAIAREVENKSMPPWTASEIHKGVFANERTLQAHEIETLVLWANMGAPRGNANEAPGAKIFPASEGWSIGQPDLVLSMPEPYFVDDDVEDLYVDFYTKVTQEQLPEDRWIKAVEFRSGSSAVHHIIARPLGGMAPGYDPVVHRPGYGHKIRKGTTVKWNMHYHKEPGPGTGVWDQTEAAIVFWPNGTVLDHTVSVESLGGFNFVIPAGDPNYTHHSYFTFPEDSLIISYNPHMHLRGKMAKYVATYPDGREEILLDVPKYDFNWQITYRYKEPKFIPKGTEVHLTAAWDNSADNPSNPDPTETVTWGRPTTAEMMFGWMKYTHVEPKPFVVGSKDEPTAGTD